MDGMARGWESKGIEAQQEEAARGRGAGRARTPEQLARDDRRRSLELMRSCALADLSRASAPAHRAMLERAIASLDEQLEAAVPGATPRPPDPGAR
jgi:hypothetical protein